VQSTPALSAQAVADLEKRGNLSAILRPARFDESDDLIEVVFLSWYGCSHCWQSEPLINRYIEQLPADVRPVKLAVYFPENELWGAHAKLFAVLDELGREKELRNSIFETIQVYSSATGHGTGLSLADRPSQEAFASMHGISKEEFNAAYDSPAVAQKLARINSFVDNADFDSVPAMVINGRYVFTYFNGQGYFELANHLIEQERERLATLKK
jgi:thiol:disulfide interchange protein DsbA